MLHGMAWPAGNLRSMLILGTKKTPRTITLSQAIEMNWEQSYHTNVLVVSPGFRPSPAFICQFPNNGCLVTPARIKKMPKTNKVTYFN
jgi:hypothetical protein